MEALDYAVEAQNWALTARIIDRHWAAMLTVDAHTLQTSLGNIPPEAASQYPAVLAGRVMLGTNPAVDNDRYPPLPQSPREVSALAATDTAKDALDIGCVRSITLRNARRVRQIGGTDPAPCPTLPAAHSNTIPTLSPPSCPSCESTGHAIINSAAPSSNPRLRRARHITAHSPRTSNSSPRTAAGTIALNRAIVGEPLHALHWSDLERKHAHRDCRHEPLIRTAGLVARTLIALDTLADDAHTALTRHG